MKLQLLRIPAALFAFALIASACGGDDEPAVADDPPAETTQAPAPAADDEPDTADTADTADTPAETTQAPAPATDDEPDMADTMMDPPAITLGYLDVVGAVEGALRLAQSAQAAADVLGWEWVYCDAEGIPDQMQTCADSLMDQGVDAIMTNGTTVEVIVDQLDRAIEEGIPFVNTGGTQSFYDKYAGSYNPDDAELGRVLAQWIVDNVPEGDIFVSSVAFTAWGGAREESLAQVIDGTGFNISNIVDVDFADPVGTAADAVSTHLTASPDTAVVWASFDASALGAGPVIADLGDDGPVLATFYAHCATQNLMANGAVDVTVEENLEWSSWVAVDQIASFFAFDQPFSTDLRPTYTDADGNELQFSQPFVVTADQANADCVAGEGPYLTPPDPSAATFREFFQQKWAQEFNLS